jgi:hypothetical protein
MQTIRNMLPGRVSVRVEAGACVASMVMTANNNEMEMRMKENMVPNLNSPVRWHSRIPYKRFSQFCQIIAKRHQLLSQRLQGNCVSL